MRFAIVAFVLALAAASTLLVLWPLECLTAAALFVLVVAGVVALELPRLRK